MYVLKISKLSELKIIVLEGCDFVEGCYRDVSFTDSAGNEYPNIALTGGDALYPLEVGQLVLIDLWNDPFEMGGVRHNEYYVLSFKPLPKDTKIETHEDWTSRLV